MLYATFCITKVLNSCWIHAEFRQNRETCLDLLVEWHLKHLAGLFMLYTIRNTVWDFSKNTAKVEKCVYFLTDLLDFNMNSTPLICKVLHNTLSKIQGKHEISMKSA